MYKKMKILIALVIGCGVSAAVAQPKLVLNITSVDFGNVRVGVFDTRTGWSTFLMTNKGTDTLRVTNIASSKAAFFASPTKIKIAPGGSFVDTLRFVPTVVGAITAELTLSSNDPAVITYKSLASS